MADKTIKIEDILNTITADDALVILKNLAMEDTEIAKRIERLTTAYLADVDVEETSDLVFSELDAIDIEDVWARSGKTRDGYNDPNDMVCEIFEEYLEPFLEELRKYQGLRMQNEAMLYCMGLLRGIYRFHKESTSQYREWAGDASAEYFEEVFQNWKNGCATPDQLVEMRKFIKDNFPEWS
jgi:hypothetical protein